MIPILAKLLGGSSLAAWLVIALLAIGSLTAFTLYEQHEASAATAIEYQGKIDTLVAGYASAKADDDERVAAVSDAAKAAEARSLAAMQADNDALTKQLQEQANAASNDSNAKRDALGIDSVRRIDAIH